MTSTKKTHRPSRSTALPELAPYRAKRDFKKTREPMGAAVQSSNQLRYVIQKHAASRLHYDLRLELDGVFKSWAVTKGPSVDPADKRLAIQVEDHPLDYGDFEGTIPKGEYGGGTVQLWDRGFWRPEGPKGAQAGLESGDLKFILDGKRLHGSWVLVRMKRDRDGKTRPPWLLIKHREHAAKPGHAQTLRDGDRSVASGRSMAQIAAGKGRLPSPFMRAAAPAVKVTRGTRTDQGHRLTAMPAFIRPQLCKLVDRPPNASGWAHEVKLDGYRAQLRVQHGVAALRTRNGLDWTKRFGAIAKDARTLPDCIIDGEVCALGPDDIPSFAVLQAVLSGDTSQELVFFAFDLLIESKRDLRSSPLSDRKRRLQSLLDNPRIGRSLRFVEHFESTADSVLQSACQMHLEGIVSKRLDSPYVSGRSGHWTKAKCRAGHEVVLGGWVSEKGSLRSLLAGVNREGHLAFVGRIGTGYGVNVTTKLVPVLEKLTRNVSPFGGANAPRPAPGILWLKPTLVADIDFAGWTASGMIRQASFKGLRVDKAARDVVVEAPVPAAAVTLDAAVPGVRVAAARRSTARKTTARKAAARKAAARKPSTRDVLASVATAPVPSVRSGPTVVMGVTLSHPDKAFWPDTGDDEAVTKLDLAEYYEQVGEWLLPHLKGRPCSLLRAPDGFAGTQFFQRHAVAGLSPLFTLVKIKDDKAPYVQIDRIEALAGVAQVGALEIHPWNCAPGEPTVAGRLVFDLDPAPDVAFAAVMAAALEIRERLTAVGLESFCKTTGGKGLHVVTPLSGGKAAVTWPAAKDFAHVICAQMAQDAPTLYLDTMSKRDRAGRIFLDYLRNDRKSTAVAVLSPRARAGAPVSMPIRWQDVKAGLDPRHFTVRTAAGILTRHKPWESYARSARSLASAIRKLTA